MGALVIPAIPCCRLLSTDMNSDMLVYRMLSATHSCIEFRWIGRCFSRRKEWHRRPRRATGDAESHRERPFRSARALLAVAALSNCAADKKAANETNFRRAIQQSLNAQPRCLPLPFPTFVPESKGDFPGRASHAP